MLYSKNAGVALIIFIFLLLFIMNGCKSSSIPVAPITNTALTTSEKIDLLADSLTTKVTRQGYEAYNLNNVGVIIGAWNNKENFFHFASSGRTEIGGSSLITQDHLFRIGSITKTFTNTIILQLVDEGKLSLEDKLSKYYPDFPLSQQVTIRMLMNMSSGIFDYGQSPLFLTANPLIPKTPQELINYAKVQPYYFAPGTGFHYSNTNTIFLGMIIEQITGRTLSEELNTRIILPLGLTHTFMPETEQFPSSYSYVRGYEFVSAFAPKVDMTTYNHPSLTWAAGGLISSFSDLKTYASALGKGTLISAKMQNERLNTINMYNTALPVYDDLKYGLGVMCIAGFIGHGGEIPGYRIFVLYSPIRDAGVVVMSNFSMADVYIVAHKTLKYMFNELNYVGE